MMDDGNNNSVPVSGTNAETMCGCQHSPFLANNAANCDDLPWKIFSPIKSSASRSLPFVNAIDVVAASALLPGWRQAADDVLP